MKKAILIATAFGLLGTSVVMIYSITTWESPLMPLVYAALGIVPLTLAGSLPNLSDEIDWQSWWKDGHLWACVLSALIASLSLPLAWSAPATRTMVLDRIGSADMAMLALKLDEHSGIRLRACKMLLRDGSSAQTSELTGRMAASPSLTLACIEETRETRPTREIARKVALRWHAALISNDDMSEEVSCKLAQSTKALPLHPQQTTTTLFDCALRASTSGARACCLEGLSKKPKRACAALTSQLTPRRMNEWGSLGLALGTSWGEPEATTKSKDAIAALDLTCAPAREFTLESNCMAIIEDTMTRDDRRYFEWVISNNTQCLKPEHLEEWVSARDVCDLIIEAKDSGKRIDEILVCNSRKALATKEIERRAAALALKEETLDERSDLAAQIVQGSDRVNGRSGQRLTRDLLGNGDCFSDRQLGAMVGQLFGGEGGLNNIDLTAPPEEIADDLIGDSLGNARKALENPKVKEQIEADDSIDQEEAAELIASFEEEGGLEEQIKEQMENAPKSGGARMTIEEREFLECMRKGRENCIPSTDTVSGFNRGGPCGSASGFPAGGLDEHIRNMEMVRP